MQQYKSSRNSRQMPPRADVCQDSGWWVGCGGAVMVRIMVTLCELDRRFGASFGAIIGNYLMENSSHNETGLHG